MLRALTPSPGPSSPSSNTSTPRVGTPVSDMMRETLIVSLLEHSPEKGHVRYQTAKKIIEESPFPKPLFFPQPNITPAGAQPPLFTIDDKINDGRLCGIFECDSLREGQEMTKYAIDLFPDLFSIQIQGLPDYRHAFIKTFARIQEEAEKRKLPGYFTCVICYLSSVTNSIYTATLGKGEAKIFRRMKDGTINAVALSCRRSWDYDREWQKAFQKQIEGKIATCPEETGVDVSRAIGINPYLRHKPKISSSQLKPGDLILLGNDHLWENSATQSVIDHFLTPHWEDPHYNFAKRIYSWKAKENPLAVISCKL